ncbi:hypothetical protein G6549_19360 [Bacillus sp. MM2020_1]|nr:hypothetical protein [Bacillus sp. MM2020_1]
MQHFIRVWRSYPISRITKKMYQNRIFDLQQYSENYMDGIHACGRMIFRHAVELGSMKVNPTENLAANRRGIRKRRRGNCLFGERRPC